MKARTRIVGVGWIIVALGCAGVAQGATINVKPKPNALQKAIDKAKKGDTLSVKPGTYREDVRVTKPLKIVGKDGPRPVVTGSCEEDIVIDVQSKAVKLKHLKVKGAIETGQPGYTVNFIGVPSGTVQDLAIQQSCEDSPQYGINIYASGNLKILDNHIYGGFRDAGIYVGSVDDTRGKTLLVDGNEANGNNRGIIIEQSDSAEQTIRVSNNNVHDNGAPGITTDPTGIFIHSSDNGLYSNNIVSDNASFGFNIDAPSDNNEFQNNTATGNIDNFNDNGSGSCGSGNTGFTVPGCM